jgi:hypothetical protein
MILRRLTTALRKQDWVTVAIETLIVVMGVFIGLQVNNWNDTRMDRSVERATLIRLYEDIEERIAGQRRDIGFLEQQLADQAVVLKALDDCAVAPKDSMTVQRGIATLGWLNPPRLYRRTIDELISSGRTDMIENSEIVDALARIVSIVEWREAWFSSTIDTLEHHSQFVESKTRYDMTRTISNPFVPNHRGGVDYDIDVLCADASVANAVSSISYRTAERLEAYRPILDAYTAFLPLLATELKDRWRIDIVSDVAP